MVWCKYIFFKYLGFKKVFSTVGQNYKTNETYAVSLLVPYISPFLNIVPNPMSRCHASLLIKMIHDTPYQSRKSPKKLTVGTLHYK